jgi:hypothetical protein
MESDHILSILSRDPWKATPPERDPLYFRTWQRTSVALQKALRQWIPDLYFRDITRFEDRDTAYQLIVYAASRPYYGQARTEFTFDMADPGALPAALRSIGHATQGVLMPVEQRLRVGRRPDVARHYMPVWYQDILIAVKKKPKILMRILADEARLINAVIDLGTSRDAASVSRFLRVAAAVLRIFLGEDMRQLIPMLLDVAAQVLTEILAERNRPPGGLDNLLDTGTFHDHHAPAARRPDRRVRDEKDRNNRRPNGGSQVGDAGIVADINPGGGEPASELVQIDNAHRLVQYFLGAGAPLDRQGKP